MLNRYKISLFLFLVFFSFSAIITAVNAIGQMTKPIVIDNALRGHDYEQTLTLLNTRNTETVFALQAEKQVTGWVTFFARDNREEAITKITVGPRKSIGVVAKFHIPDDAPNGQYTGFISVLTVPAENEDNDKTVATVRQKIDRQVTINVSDKEVIDLKTDIRVKKYNVEIGKPIELLITYNNDGNIVLKPQVKIKTSQKTSQIDEVYTNIIIPFPEDQDGVKPLNRLNIPVIKIPTDGVLEGKLDLGVEILLNNEIVQEKNMLVGVNNAPIINETVVKNFWTDLARKNVIYLAIGVIVILAFGAIILWRKK